MKKLPGIKQALVIAKIELRRAFFSKRAFWVYGLALFPTVIFLAYTAQVKFRRVMLSSVPPIRPALMDSVREGETVDAVLERLGKAPVDYEWQRRLRIRSEEEDTGITTHTFKPAIEARYILMNIIRPTYSNDPIARICEFEVYGDNNTNLALNRPAVGSSSCNDVEGPEKAFNGNAQDFWCSRVGDRYGQIDPGEPAPPVSRVRENLYLQVDLGEVVAVNRIVLKHASAGGKPRELNTSAFNIQISNDNKIFKTVVNMAGTRMMQEITRHRRMTYFDGKREATLDFTDGKLETRTIRTIQNFEEDRSIFARVFQLFYLRLAIFFGCLGIFMNLFRGEVLDKTLHYWFLAPARREVLLAGKYGAGLIASSIIFAGGALLCFTVVMSTHNSAEVQAYLQGAGMQHVFWYAAAAVMGCIGYGSVFLAAGLLLRNPIIPAAVLLGWESINGFLPATLQKISILYYLQSLCPVPIQTNNEMPALLQLLLAPAAPASHFGAIAGLIIVTLVVLWIARIAIRRMEISYSNE
jgi:ABC-type transport system involved in multi-copper enzyme maturation permease subunit